MGFECWYQRSSGLTSKISRDHTRSACLVRMSQHWTLSSCRQEGGGGLPSPSHPWPMLNLTQVIPARHADLEHEPLGPQPAGGLVGPCLWNALSWARAAMTLIGAGRDLCRLRAEDERLLVWKGKGLGCQAAERIFVCGSPPSPARCSSATSEGCQSSEPIDPSLHGHVATWLRIAT